MGPTSAFGVFNALQASTFNITSSRPCIGILSRLALVIFWTWVNLLPFAIDNQREAAAIKEDGVNKPWRPLPSGRVEPAQAKTIMLALYPIAFLVSTRVGGTRQCLALVALGYWYNDCKGGDKSCIVRNMINACGFVCYTSGAMEVALGSQLPLSLDILKWFLITGLVVFSTVQSQDMYDQAGDSLRGRRTVPLVLGDGPSRWTIAIPMVIWCWFVPWY